MLIVALYRIIPWDTRFPKGLLTGTPNHPPIMNWQNSFLASHFDFDHRIQQSLWLSHRNRLITLLEIVSQLRTNLLFPGDHQRLTPELAVADLILGITPRPGVPAPSPCPSILWILFPSSKPTFSITEETNKSGGGSLLLVANLVNRIIFIPTNI